ncbi:MAG: zinc ribbon domain-containing protein [Lachnospiraceae bacterium]|nr:zinc ribbon domain-containing protein [Lachnospiraceae bacterium]
MRICENCGAEIPEGSVVCPFCGAESMVLAAEEQESIIEGFREGIKDLERQDQEHRVKAEEIAEKGNKVISRVGMLAVILIPCIVIIALVTVYVGSKYSFFARDKKMAKLEEYYAARDYESMDKYIDKHIHKDYVSYQVYSDLASLGVMQEYYVSLPDDCLRYYDECDREVLKEYVASDIYYMFCHLAKIEADRKEDVRYGKDEAFAELSKEMRDALKDKLYFTDEDIDAKLAEEFSGEADFTDYAELALSRLDKEQQ